MNASQPTPPRPPRWAERLLTWLHPSETREEVQGDLRELFTDWHRRAGVRRARIRYVWGVLSV
ncbi:MAG: hypothetical protein H7Z75_08805, partial [Ferruginibacter sp.]|nr:hypothetical protein [Cytophagales bacterium]